MKPNLSDNDLIFENYDEVLKKKVQNTGADPFDMKVIEGVLQMGAQGLEDLFTAVATELASWDPEEPKNFDNNAVSQHLLAAAKILNGRTSN